MSIIDLHGIGARVSYICTRPLVCFALASSRPHWPGRDCRAIARTMSTIPFPSLSPTTGMPFRDSLARADGLIGADHHEGCAQGVTFLSWLWRANVGVRGEYAKDQDAACGRRRGRRRHLCPRPSSSSDTPFTPIQSPGLSISPSMHRSTTLASFRSPWQQESYQRPWRRSGGISECQAKQQAGANAAGADEQARHH